MFAMFLCMCACTVEQNYFSFFLCKSLFHSLRARAHARACVCVCVYGLFRRCLELSCPHSAPLGGASRTAQKTLVASFSARPAAPGPGNRWREG